MEIMPSFNHNHNPNSNSNPRVLCHTALIFRGLSSSYHKLPKKPIKLSVLKLDGSSFCVEVSINATVADVKSALEDFFTLSPKDHRYIVSCLSDSRSRKLAQRSERVKSVDLHPTEPWILTSLYSGTVCIWDYQSQDQPSHQPWTDNEDEPVKGNVYQVAYGCIKNSRYRMNNIFYSDTTCICSINIGDIVVFNRKYLLRVSTTTCPVAFTTNMINQCTCK